MELVPLEDKKFGLWRVISRATSERGMTRYVCRCECGTESVVYAKHLRSGSSRGCHPCSVKRGRGHPQWKGVGDISANWWGNHIGRSATLHARRPIELTITPEYAWELFLKQDRRCALSGLPLTFSKKPGENTASLDRIDSSKGYVEGNVQWLHKHVNLMKNAHDQNYFVELCKLVARNT